ncbi:hypothetical protein GQ44DRAFT_291165 [Phaeosphaeriaceae sp. PMI808]|nr:hypothetical protein GQ44DRAFT_291165 [Phaeosphaeriaceae sp. PMI808]
MVVANRRRTTHMMTLASLFISPPVLAAIQTSCLTGFEPVAKTRDSVFQPQTIWRPGRGSPRHGRNLRATDPGCRDTTHPACPLTPY